MLQPTFTLLPPDCGAAPLMPAPAWSGPPLLQTQPDPNRWHPAHYSPFQHPSWVQEGLDKMQDKE